MHTTPAVLYCIGVGGRISPDVQSLNFFCSRIIVTREGPWLECRVNTNFVACQSIQSILWILLILWMD